MTTKKEKLKLNKNKADIKSFTKTKKEIKEGKYDKGFESGRDKRNAFMAVDKFIRDEQKKVEKAEKRGVGGVGRTISETPKTKKPGIRQYSKEFFYKKGGSVKLAKKYFKGGMV